MGLCEGPITSINNVYTGSLTPVTFASTNLTLFDGTTPQAPWSYLVSNYPSQVLGYPGLAYVCEVRYDLGSSASVGSNSFEVHGPLYGTGVNGVDADPAQVIYDFLTNSQYGVGFPPSSISMTNLLSNSGDSSYQTYCWATGLAISPVLSSQETGLSILSRWLQVTNSTCIWSDGLLKVIPFGDAVVTGTGKTFTPNLTPIYSLTDEDYVYKDGQNPINTSRTDPFSVKNWITLELTGRLDNYNTGPIPAFDQAAIDQFGLRLGPTTTAHEICDLNVARIAAQLILQRGLYIRRTFMLTLGEEFCLLEPMDLISLTDTVLGLNAQTVRITDIEEMDDCTFQITCEEFPGGIATAPLYPVQTKSNGAPNATATPPAVNTPALLEPTSAITGGVNQLWIGASGSGGGANWGGCYVWISLDNVSYEVLTPAISQPAKQGVLTASLPAYAGSNPDNVDTLSVDLTESSGSLSTTTSASAAGGYNLCVAGSEYLTFTTATLVTTSKYNLTGLYRGLDGSSPGLDASASQFCLLDNAIWKYNLPESMIGQTLYIKLQSFNLFEAEIESLSSCTAYSYVVQGTGSLGPVASALAVGTSMDYGLWSQKVSESDTFGTWGGTVIANIDLGSYH
jgi:hypothetical protein